VLFSPQFTVMRLWSLCEALLLLCLCAQLGFAAGGRALAIRRPQGQPRIVDRTAHIKDQSLGQVLAWNNQNPWLSKPPLSPKTDVVTPRTIIPRKLVRRNTFCRPKSSVPASGANGTVSTSPERGKRLYVLTTLVVVLLLHST